MAKENLRVRDKAVNVSYKGILRISPDESGNDYNIEEMFDRMESGCKLVIRDSDGNDTPIAFSTSGVYINGSLNTKDLNVGGAATFSGDFNLKGNVTAESISVGSLNVSGDMSVGGVSNIDNLVAHNTSLVVQSGGKTNVYQLSLNDTSSKWGYVVEYDKSDATNLKIKTTPLFDKLDELGLFNTGGGSSPSPTVSGNSVGDIKWTFANIPPLGWIKMDGKCYNQQSYKTLYNFLKNNCGFGSDVLFDSFEEGCLATEYAGTFRVPDIRGLFPRFASDNDDILYGGKHTAGNFQAAGAPNINGKVWGAYFGYGEWDTTIVEGDLDKGNVFDVPTDERYGWGTRGGGGGDPQNINLYIDARRRSWVYDNYIEEIRPHNITFNAYIYSGINENVVAYRESIVEQVNEIMNRETLPEHKCFVRVGKLAKRTNRPEYRYADCVTWDDMMAAGIDEKFSTIRNYNLMSFEGGEKFGKDNTDLWRTRVCVFNCDLPSLKDASYLFKAGNTPTDDGVNTFLSYFKSKLPKAEKLDYMFMRCDNLRYVDIEAPVATTFENCLGYCYNLQYLRLNLPKVINPSLMNYQQLTKCELYFNETDSIDFCMYDCSELSDVTLEAERIESFVKEQWFNSYVINKARLVLPNLKNNNSVYSNHTFLMNSRNSLKEFSGSLKSFEYGNYRNSGNAGTFQGFNVMESFCCDLQNLVEARDMFSGCSSLTKLNFPNGLANLRNASYMFYSCTSLKDFGFVLSNLEGNINPSTKYGDSYTGGQGMFRGCSSLKTLGTEENYQDKFPKLSMGYEMFVDCISLYEVNESFSNLVDGRHMFDRCYNLRTLKNINLENLELGDNMFWGCYIDIETIKRIADTIKRFPTGTAGNIYIGVGNDNITDEHRRALGILQDKGWNLSSNKNWGSPITPIQN